MTWQIVVAMVVMGLAGLGGIIWLAMGKGVSSERARQSKEQQDALDGVVRDLSRRRRRGRDLLDRLRDKKDSDSSVS